VNAFQDDGFAVHVLHLRKGKDHRKHSLHGKIAASVFIKAVYQWKFKMPFHRRPLAHVHEQ